MMKILNWFKRHWILSIFLLVTGVPAGLNYSGFCIEQGRWLSDEEFLLAMLGYKEGDTIRNEEREKFLKDNPECCVFTRGSVGMMKSPFSWLDRITGSIYASGQVEYKRSNEDRKRINWNETHYRNYMTINTCGKAYNNFGEEITEKEYGASYERYLYNKNKK